LPFHWSAAYALLAVVILALGRTIGATDRQFPGNATT
jgi:hypothetical protein